MCESRNKLKWCLKKWKGVEAKIYKRKMVDEFENGYQAQFWDEVKRRYPNSDAPASYSGKIGEATTVPEILELWREHFSLLADSQKILSVTNIKENTYRL